MVTAEIAVAIPSLLVLLAFALTAISVASGQLRCIDSAREVARAESRGEPVAVARELSNQLAPAGASVRSVNRPGGRIEVTVTGRISALGGMLPSFSVHATAVSLREPDGSESP